MRHNSVNHNYPGFMSARYVDRPAKLLAFSKPTRERSYIRILKFIKDHPGLTRREILLHKDYPCKTDNLEYDIRHYPAALAGYNSSLFANFLYQDFIDYDRKFRYVIKPNGLDLLAKVGL